MTNSDNPKYLRALPNYSDLDSADDGKKFANWIKETCANREFDNLVLDLSGAYVDYWGCSAVSDACIEILGRGSTKRCGKLTVITSFRNELGAQYAMLFFYKSRLHNSQIRAYDNYDSISEAAQSVCKSKNLEFNVHVVSPTFEYSSTKALGAPNFVLSSKP